MIKVISLKHKLTNQGWWAKVVAKNQFRTATGTRQIPTTEPHAFARAIYWAQENAINQLKETKYV